MDDAAAVILAEGIGDQIAIETLAARQNRNLEHEGVVVFPIGGAGAFASYLTQFGPLGQDLPLAGLADLDEEHTVRRALVAAGLGPARTRGEMADVGFFLCDRNLGEELIRACGVERALAIVEAQGELASFERLCAQPPWRDRPAGEQLRRFLKSKSGRDLRYAHLLTEAAPDDRMPAALLDVLAAAVPQ